MAEELSRTHKVPKLIEQTLALIKQHPTIMIAGDSTMRQFMMGMAGFLMTLKEFGVVSDWNDIVRGDEIENKEMKLDFSRLVSVNGEGNNPDDWTSEGWMAFIMHGCPKNKKEWQTNSGMKGGRCAYGDNQMIVKHKGSVQDPAIDNTKLSFAGSGEASVIDWIGRTAKVLSPNPSLMLVNFRTLHFFQVYPEKGFEDFVVSNNLLDQEVFREFFRKEIFAIIDLLSGLGGGTLVYRTVNAVCEDAYQGDWGAVFKAWDDGVAYNYCLSGECEDKVFEDCDQFVTDAFPTATWGDLGPCRESQLAHAGALRMMKMEKKYIEEIIKERQPNDEDVQLTYLNAFTLTSPNCDLSQDGRHFAKMNIALLYAISSGLT
ncbi:hypothetical protein TrLO_g738 [Triparma laevis f. longispina]|uniref:Uncharacterized protein n=1 Tax=Triparma laevis f. longispina TaxID=1714387 RepID=A0A9W7DUI8_9STRA|nr:hypothetical protein TrLO_g738 [Triparma laevis f. longispina]